MRAHDLDSLRRDYGDELISLPGFAGLVGVTTSALRFQAGKGDDDDDDSGPEPAPGLAFPVAAQGGSSPSYLLGELIEWFARTRLTPSLEHWSISPWTIARSAERCAMAHGADRTFRCIAAAALMLADGWQPKEHSSGPSLYMAQLLTRARSASISRQTAQSDVLLPPGFEPDPPPVDDPKVMARLLDPDWAADAGRTDDPANLLVAELARAWAYFATHDQDAFIAIVEDQVALQIARTPTGRPGTPDVETRLLVTLADLRPGHVVVDPAIGEGSAALAAHDATADDLGRQRIGIVGREIDERTWCYTKMRFGLRGIAHALGDPGADGLEAADLPGRYERVIADPGATSRQVRRWMKRIAELVTVDGIAVVQVAAADAIPPRARSGAWTRLGPHLAALVLSPAQPGAPRGTATFVIQHDFTGPVLLAQIQPRPSRRLDPTTVDAAITTVSALVHAHRDAPSSVPRHWDGDVYIRSLATFTLDAFAPPDWDDTRVLRDAIQRRLADDESSDAETTSLATRPPTARATRAEKEEAAALAQAQRAVTLLRWLTDPDFATSPPPVVLSERQRARFAAETTREIRLALERLERRLNPKPGSKGTVVRRSDTTQ